MTQEGINKTRMITLVLLAGVTVLFFFFDSSLSGSDIDKDLFRVGDLSAIDRVILKSQQESITLSYDGVRWRVNDSQAADTRMVTILFATLEQAVPKRKAAVRLHENLDQRITTDGVEVSLYRGDELEKKIISIGNERKTETYFVAEGEGSYLMTIPGYRVYVAGIFEMPAVEWREKRIFNFNWRNFKSLSAAFPGSPQQDFSIERMDGVFGIAGMQHTDTTKLNDYLDDVSLTEANQFVSANRGYDSLLKIQPILHLQLKDIADRHYSLEIFESDTRDRYLGRTEDGSLLILSRQRMEPLARRRDYFVAD
jgi:hypothetical protein